MNIKNDNDYTGIKNNCLFVCECGNEYITTVQSILKSNRRNGCKKCQKRKKSNRRYALDNDVYMGRVNKLWGVDISILSDYNGGEKMIKCKCNSCDNIWETIARSITRGHGCPKCSHIRTVQSRLKTNDVFKSELLNVHNGRLCAKNDYVNSYTKINFICTVCGNEWLANPAMILRGRGCPKCNLSKGEILISEILNGLGVEYKEQFIIEGLKTDKGGTPRFDFALLKNGDLRMIIEFDGVHHYEPIKRFGGIKRLREQEEVDEFKNSYCSKNNIIMSRIKYTEIDKIDTTYIKRLISDIL